MCNMNFYRETSRLILRSPRESDAVLLAEKRSAEFVMKFNLYEICDAEQIKNEFEYFEHIVLTLKDTNEVIGCISIRDDYLRYRMDSFSLQAWLTLDMASQGYMTEAISAVLEYLFNDCSCERVSAQIFSDNVASIRLVQKLGFENEGYLKRAVKRKDGCVFDLVLFSMDYSMFQTSKKE